MSKRASRRRRAIHGMGRITPPSAWWRAASGALAPRIGSMRFPSVSGFHIPLRIHLSASSRRAWTTVGAQLVLLARITAYRLTLLGATFLFAWALLWLQERLGAVPAHPSSWQRGVQWAELIWLIPIPLSLALWIGWFVFAGAALPNPTPISTPVIATRTRGRLPIRLVFRFITHGDNVEVLRESVAAVHDAVASYTLSSSPYRIEIATERPITLDGNGVERVFVVPKSFKPRHGARYKARALAYLQERVAPEPEDWYVYLDEESSVDFAMLAGIYRFIHAADDAQRAGRVPRVIGQGGILYQGGHWFYRGADALRTADDLGRFRLQYALGMPLFGIHGSFIVVRGKDNARLSFDVGPASSITEDAAWALRAWARGYRFGWVEGFLHEQPPQTIADFVRQRARWLRGIRLVLRDHVIPLRYRICLGVFTLLWQLSFLPFVVAVAALFAHVAPLDWMRLPADFAWATFVLAYIQGAHVQAVHAHPREKGVASLLAGRPRWLTVPIRALLAVLVRLAAWSIALCYIWYALLEAVSVVYSLIPSSGFFVISKPSLAARQRQPAQRTTAPPLTAGEVLRP